MAKDAIAQLCALSQPVEWASGVTCSRWMVERVGMEILMDISVTALADCSLLAVVSVQWEVANLQSLCLALRASRVVAVGVLRRSFRSQTINCITHIGECSMAVNALRVCSEVLLPLSLPPIVGVGGMSIGVCRHLLWVVSEAGAGCSGLMR